MMTVTISRGNRGGMFRNMGGNFLGRDFPGEDFPGGSLMGGDFPGGSIPDTEKRFSDKYMFILKRYCVSHCFYDIF